VYENRLIWREVMAKFLNICHRARKRRPF